MHQHVLKDGWILFDQTTPHFSPSRLPFRFGTRVDEAKILHKAENYSDVRYLV